jgi:chondroitin 4-sulfotransferase 11
MCVHPTDLQTNSLKRSKATRLRNLARLKNLRDKCAELNLNNGSILEMAADELGQLLVDQKHKILYFYIPKVACTTWKRILMVMAGKWNGTDFAKIPFMTAHNFAMNNILKFPNLTLDEKIEVLNTYTKFMIVRDPFERLYRDNFEKRIKNMTPRFQKFSRLLVNNKDLLQRLVPMAIKPSNTLNQTPPHDLEFYQLIQYVLSPPMAQLKNQPLDHHLRPMNELVIHA